MTYHKAVSYSIKAKSGDNQALSKVNLLVDSLPTAYKQYNNPLENKYIKWALNQIDNKKTGEKNGR